MPEIGFGQPDEATNTTDAKVYEMFTNGTTHHTTDCRQKQQKRFAVALCVLWQVPFGAFIQVGYKNMNICQPPP